MNKNKIYPTLEEEVYKTTNWNRIHLKTGISINALLQKRKGESEFRLSECFEIKNLIGYKGSIEELFARAK